MDKLEEVFKVRSFFVKKLSENDYLNFKELCLNQGYFFDCLKEDCVDANIKDLFEGKPSNALHLKKYMYGFYLKSKLIAVLDLMCDYPTSKSVFINLFMVSASLQGGGVGSEIIKRLKELARLSKFESLHLGVIETNKKAKNFWQKQGFEYLNIKYNNEKYNVEMMGCRL